MPSTMAQIREAFEQGELGGEVSEGDIDDLQSQIDDLDSRVSDLEGGD